MEQHHRRTPDHQVVVANATERAQHSLWQAGRLILKVLTETSLVARIREVAGSDPDAMAIVFLEDGELREQRITYGELDARARNLAARLVGSVGEGERALLLYPPGLQFAEAFYACLYAGVVAVPAYPPDLVRPRVALERLTSIVGDCKPRAILTTSAWRETRRESAAAQAPWLSELQWIETDVHEESAAQLPALTEERLAFLQYTSGSTSSPKGVMVTHGNLVANHKAIAAALGLDRSAVVVSWLPLYHDMGLIGNLLLAGYLGGRCVLMSPAHFMQKPSRWLRAISRHRGTVSGGPNFAFDLCVQRASTRDRDELDLSSWKVAFNGAEPVRAETLARFEQAFHSCGLSRNAILPLYGLAEATLMVTGRSPLQGPAVDFVSRAGLEDSRRMSATDSDRHAMVSCGAAIPAHRVRIVDPASGQVCSDGQIGEIWVNGPSVARGYWGRPAESRKTFGAKIEGDPDDYLRTGDLGYLWEGELFVTGRIKDLIIIRGRNLTAHDIESVVARCDKRFRPSCAAAFAVDWDNEEGLVIVQEAHAPPEADLRSSIEHVRLAVSEAFQVDPVAIVLIAPRTIPKTSSGKIQRGDCRKAFIGGRLDVLASWEKHSAATQIPLQISREEIEALEPSRRHDALMTVLGPWLAQKRGIRPGDLTSASSLDGIGLDSLWPYSCAACSRRNSALPFLRRNYWEHALLPISSTRCSARCPGRPEKSSRACRSIRMRLPRLRRGNERFGFFTSWTRTTSLTTWWPR
jgi:acyl-CoA synthetase (AMP-forming)/AMP-acid ligase II